jgi:hypothetical protein
MRPDSPVVPNGKRNCTRDEGGPFGVGNQVLISSHRKLLRSKAVVVSVAETSGHDPVARVWCGRQPVRQVPAARFRPPPRIPSEMAETFSKADLLLGVEQQQTIEARLKATSIPGLH